MLKEEAPTTASIFTVVNWHWLITGPVTREGRNTKKARNRKM